VNPVFVEWAASISSGSGNWFGTSDAWWQLGRYLVLCAPAAIFGWAAVAVRCWRREPEAWWCATGIALIVALWCASIPYTGGGLFYSMRVLSPAFGLSAVFGGTLLSRASGAPVARKCFDAALAILVLLTLPMTLTLPHNAFRLPPREWSDVGRQFVDDRRTADAEVAAELLKLPDQSRILSECVSLPRALRTSAITVVPMWSPEVAWLFDPRVTPATVAQRWRSSGLRYVVMTRSPVQLALLNRRAAWSAEFFAIRRIWQSEGYVIFEVITTASDG
jgi:hypothetical protein